MASKISDSVARETKKLRSSEPDLKVVLGSGDDESIQWYHSQALASKSRYIDAMLSTPMKEKDAHVISFPDITPDAWATMMNYLESPVAARKMRARDASAVSVLYDKYEFTEGSKLCDEVMVEYFKSLKDMEKSRTLDLDSIIEFTLVALKANLGDALKEGIKYLLAKMKSVDIEYGRTMFSEEHMEKMLPILKHFRDNRNQAPGVIMPILDMGKELEKPDFCKEFVSKNHAWQHKHLLQQCISHIELEGSTCDADGEFEKDYPSATEYCADERKVRWGGQIVTFRIKWVGDGNFKGWAIVRRYPPTHFDEDGEPDEESIVEKKCWIAPYSQDHQFPPLRGWVSADRLARGNPTIKYSLHDSIG